MQLSARPSARRPPRAHVSARLAKPREQQPHNSGRSARGSPGTLAALPLVLYIGTDALQIGGLQLRALLVSGNPLKLIPRSVQEGGTER